MTKAYLSLARAEESAAAAAAAAAAKGGVVKAERAARSLEQAWSAGASKRKFGEEEAKRLSNKRSAAGRDASMLVKAASDLLARAGVSLRPDAKAMMKEKARLSAEVAALEASAGRMSARLKALDGAAKALTCPLTLEIFVDPVVSKYGVCTLTVPNRFSSSARALTHSSFLIHVPRANCATPQATPLRGSQSWNTWRAAQTRRAR